MKQIYVEVTADALVDLEDFGALSFDELRYLAEQSGYEVYDPDAPVADGMAEFIQNRHSNEHQGTILTCRDDVCDFFIRQDQDD